MPNNNNYVSSRIESSNTSQACFQIEHDTRTRPPKYLQGDAHSETYIWGIDRILEVTGRPEDLQKKTIENDENRNIVRNIVKQSAKEQQQRYLLGARRKPQKNANWFVRGILTFSPEGVPGPNATEEERERFNAELWAHAKNYIETVAARLNVNPVYMSLHCDETTVHVHYLLENSDKDTGRSVSRKIKPSDCRKLQDLAGEEFAPMGFQRGVSREVTGARHKTVRESHRAEQKKLEKETQSKVETLNEVADEIGGLELRREALEVDTREEKRRAKRAEKARKEEELKKAEAERATAEAVRRAEEAQREAAQYQQMYKNELTKLNQIRAARGKMTQEAEQMSQLIKLEQWAEAEAEAVRDNIDRDAPGFAEFERFLKATGAKVVQIQEQECAADGGAAKWQKWHAPKVVTVERLLALYSDMQGANRAPWNPSDWHVRLIGTPPVWTFDDLSPSELEKMRNDGLAPFATIETSPGNYQAWIKLRSDKEYLRPNDWHSIQRHLQKKYGADKGAGGAEHAFRLPLPGALSHKREKPFKMRVSIDIEENAETKSVGEVLATIPAWEKEPQRIPISTFSALPELWNGDEVEIPSWFSEKWERRRAELAASKNCPKKQDGTPDWSSVDFRIASQSLWGYKDRDENQQALVALWLTRIIADEAARRGKPKPIKYAQRTVFSVANQLWLDIVRHAQRDFDRDDSDRGNPLLEHANAMSMMSEMSR